MVKMEKGDFEVPNFQGEKEIIYFYNLMESKCQQLRERNVRKEWSKSAAIFPIIWKKGTKRFGYYFMG